MVEVERKEEGSRESKVSNHSPPSLSEDASERLTSDEVQSLHRAQSASRDAEAVE